MNTNPNPDVGHAEPAARRWKLKTCASCQHQVVRSKARRPDSTELQMAGELNAYDEWQQREKQHAQREAQLVASGGRFTYEPRHYAWCAAFTPRDLVESASCDAARVEQLLRAGAAVLDPVSGRVSAVYALCAHMNARGDCVCHESR